MVSQAVAVCLVVGLAAYSFLSCYWASLLDAPTEQEQWMPDDHMLTRATYWNDDYLSNDNDAYAQLDIIWGLKGLDRSAFDQYYPVSLMSFTELHTSVTAA
jgi:hypothetical protein